MFISMTSSDLLDRTSQYQMQGHSPLQNIDESEPLFSDDPNENRPLSRRRDSSVQRIIPPPISNLTSRSNNHNMGTTYNADVNGTSASRNSLQHIDRGDDNVSNPRSGIHPAASEFAVTTTCNDPSSDEEETSSAATLADRYRRDRLLPPYELSSEEDTEDGLERAMRRARSMGIPSSQNYYRRSRRKAQPSKIEIMRPAGVASLDSRSGESKRVLAPHASFFIERDRSVISVKFDPPVLVPLSWLMVDLADPSIHPRSGKFVLLKLWSPSRDENIDIQSIMAHGFAGPRFFPAAHRM